MKITVLLSSGSEDEWEDVGNAEMTMDLGGALVITSEPLEDGTEKVLAVYAPGMWMKAEFDQ